MPFNREDTLDFIASHCADMLQLANEADFKTLAHLFAMAEQEAKSVQAAMKANGVTSAFKAIETGALMRIATSSSRNRQGCAPSR